MFKTRQHPIQQSEIAVPFLTTMPTRQGQDTGLKRAARATLFVTSVGAALFLGGFLQFVDTVSHLTPDADARADAIVVLTGGRDRIKAAVDLLDAGRGQRLLISGVYHLTKPEDLRRESEARASLYACCVDLGFKAETTIGNAAETAQWTHDHGFRSLVVVTSAYHMPRALAIFRHALPNVTLVPHPVHPTDVNAGTLARHPDTLKLLLLEYVKYRVAWLKLVAEAP